VSSGRDWYEVDRLFRSNQLNVKLILLLKFHGFERL